ncbi:MAG: hypothetical protein L0338_24075 [Acidobacteria bacterium]|nr:hypothetical protein [Acidobacteriota bacterium]
MDNLLAGIRFLLETIEKKTYQQIAQRTLHSERFRDGVHSFRDGVHSFRDGVHLFRSGEKVDNIAPESLDNFLRNRWTTSTGISGQLAPEYAAVTLTPGMVAPDGSVNVPRIVAVVCWLSPVPSITTHERTTRQTQVNLRFEPKADMTLTPFVMTRKTLDLYRFQSDIS